MSSSTVLPVQRPAQAMRQTHEYASPPPSAGNLNTFCPAQAIDYSGLRSSESACGDNRIQYFRLSGRNGAHGGRSTRVVICSERDSGAGMCDPPRDLLLTRVTVEHGRGWFQGVSQAIDSPIPSEPVELGALLASLPELASDPLRGERWRRPLFQLTLRMDRRLPFRRRQFPVLLSHRT